MGMSAASYEKRERLAHIVDMLNAMSAVASRDGSDLLRYFVELAVAQARDEYAALDKGQFVDRATRTLVSLN